MSNLKNIKSLFSQSFEISGVSRSKTDWISYYTNLIIYVNVAKTGLISYFSVESTALRLITGLGSNEVQPQLSRFLSEPKTLVSAESEELNRALVLTLARSMHITGTGTDTQSGMWCKELLNTIMQNTPHNWPSHTLQCFPTFLAEYFQQNPAPKENRQELKVCIRCSVSYCRVLLSF